MNVNTELANLQELLRREPELPQALRGVENVDQAIERINAVAGRHGIVLEAAELEALSTALASQIRVTTALEALQSKDDSLAQTLEGLGQNDQIVSAIMDSADRHGIAIDAVELAAYLRLVSKNGAPEELSDAELAGVTGGGFFEDIGKILFLPYTIPVSILTGKNVTGF